MKKLFGLCTLVLVLLLALGGCPTESEDDPKPDPIPGLKTGTATKTADGFAATPAPDYIAEHGATPGAQVSVKVTVVTDGYIDSVVITGPDESTGIGSLLMDRAPAIIKKKNSFEIKAELDAITEASFTRDAIIEAGNAAVEAIKNQ
jgi:hypothetical protein